MMTQSIGAFSDGVKAVSLQFADNLRGCSYRQGMRAFFAFKDMQALLAARAASQP